MRRLISVLFILLICLFGLWYVRYGSDPRTSLRDLFLASVQDVQTGLPSETKGTQVATNTVPQQDISAEDQARQFQEELDLARSELQGATSNDEDTAEIATAAESMETELDQQVAASENQEVMGSSDEDDSSRDTEASDHSDVKVDVSNSKPAEHEEALGSEADTTTANVEIGTASAVGTTIADSSEAKASLKIAEGSQEDLKDKAVTSQNDSKVALGTESERLEDRRLKLQYQRLLAQASVVAVVQFERKSEELTVAGMRRLLNAFSVLQRDTSKRIAIVGHTDGTGARWANRLLSKDRAHTVAVYLSDLDIDAARFVLIPQGASIPVGDNATAEGRYKNRRVEVFLFNK